MDAPTAHNALSGLSADDHPQYLLPTEVVAGANVTVDRSSLPGSVVVAASNPGVTAHHLLTGLTGDDHTQYHTDARGDLRYIRKDVDNTTTGVVTGHDFIVEGAPGTSSNFAFSVNGTVIWQIMRNGNNDLVIDENSDAGNHFRSRVTFKRMSGEVIMPGAITFTDPGTVITLEGLNFLVQQGNVLIPAKGNFVHGNASYAGGYADWTGRVGILSGMYKVNTAFNVTAGTEYLLCQIPGAPTYPNPIGNYIWPGGMFSLTGSTGGSTVCRLRLSTNGEIRFMAPANGSFTTSGWVSISGPLPVA
jgi:hypothetical protein